MERITYTSFFHMIGMMVQATLTNVGKTVDNQKARQLYEIPAHPSLLRIFFVTSDDLLGGNPSSPHYGPQHLKFTCTLVYTCRVHLHLGMYLLPALLRGA